MCAPRPVSYIGGSVLPSGGFLSSLRRSKGENCQCEQSIELESADLVASAIEEEEDSVISKGKGHAKKEASYSAFTLSHCSHGRPVWGWPGRSSREFIVLA